MLWIGTQWQTLYIACYTEQGKRKADWLPSDQYTHTHHSHSLLKEEVVTYLHLCCDTSFRHVWFVVWINITATSLYTIRHKHYKHYKHS